MKAKPPNLTLAGREHIASAADNVRLPAKRVATGPQQADHSPTGPENPGNVGSGGFLSFVGARADGEVAPIADLGYLERGKPMPDLAGLPVSIKDLFDMAGELTRRR